MAIVDRATLKTYFEAGDKPTQDQFTDLIDSFLNFLDDGIYGMQKITIAYTDFQPSSLSSVYIDSVHVPAGFQVSRIIIRPTETFIGGTIAGSEMNIRDSSESREIINTYISLSTTISDTIGIISPGYTEDFTTLSDVDSDSFLRLYMSVSGATDGFNDLSQGSLDIYYSLDKLI